MKALSGSARGFAVLWPFAGLMHLLSLGEQGSSTLGMILWGIALLAITFAGRSWALALYGVAQCIELWIRLPWVANHWLYVSWVNLLLLAGIFWTGRRPGQAWRWPSLCEMLRQIRPVLLWGLALLYAMALFHKLNWDYWDPKASCAMALAQSVPYFPVLEDGSWIRRAVIVGSMLLETAIPVLLLISRTRWLGILIGAAFHVLLGFVPFETYYNFSILLLAIYVALLPDKAWARIEEAIERLYQKAGQLRYLGLALLWGLGIYVVIDAQSMFKAAEWTYRGVLLFWGLGPLLWLGLLWGMRRPGDRQDSLRLWEKGKVPRWGVLLLAFLGIHALGPYLGWKSELSFSMYSNLRVMNGGSNHWVLPRTLDLWGWQSDWVQIRRSSSMRLEGLRRKKQQMTWFEFQDALARDCGVSARFNRGGKRYKRVRGDRSAPFAAGRPWWLRKLVRFRPVDLGAGQGCVH